MNENIFQLDDTYWLQLDGTAMGTLAACMYVTISYGIHQIENILDRFKNIIVLYKRYIDDIFRVWTPTPNHQLDAAEWLLFTQALNAFAKLKWKVEELSDTTNFLDLTLTLIDGKMQSATFQKTMNLYLYIPALSAHPKGCLKGLIT